MSRQPVSARRRLALAGALAVLGALCVLVLRAPDDAVTSSPGEGPPASAPARVTSAGEAPSDKPLAGPARPLASSEAEPEGSDDESAEEGADPPPSRREQYTAAFDRKIGRIQQRVTDDCGEHESLARLFDDFAAVRDRIVESAVATDNGQKTKAEQRRFERAQLQELDEKVCRTVAGLSLPRACMRHFHGCERTL